LDICLTYMYNNLPMTTTGIPIPHKACDVVFSICYFEIRRNISFAD